MKMINRFIYLGYYISELDFSTFMKFLRFTSKHYGKTYLAIIFDIIKSVFTYNISILEYFQFGFIEKSDQEKREWAGTGFMYESINELNPRKYRSILSDKIKFIQKYKPFLVHRSIPVDRLESDDADALINKNDKILLKHSEGQCGRGIEVLDTKGLTREEVINMAKSTGNNMVEEYIVQHDELQKLSPSGLNTLRVITQLNKSGEVDILGVRLRITNDSFVDNLAAGNIAAPVDEKTGIVIGKGIFSDITKDDVEYHPVTGVKITGFKVPRFEEAMNLAKKAALFDRGNTSVGWDIAITNDGVGLVEGNHDWCKLLWQLPAKKGLRTVLAQYTKDTQ